MYNHPFNTGRSHLERKNNLKHLKKQHSNMTNLLPFILTQSVMTLLKLIFCRLECIHSPRYQNRKNNDHKSRLLHRITQGNKSSQKQKKLKSTSEMY